MSTPSVDELVGRDEWEAVNRTQRRPFVVYKFAATLDGRIAAEDGTSQWITSATSRADILRLDLLHVAHSGTDIRLVGRPSQESTPGRAPAAGGGSGRRAW